MRAEVSMIPAPGWSEPNFCPTSPEFSYRRRVEHGVGSEQARYGENGRADVCGEGWVAHEQHRQSGSDVGMYVDCAVSGSCQVAACRNRT